MSDHLQLFDSSIQVIPTKEITLSNGETAPSAIGNHSITISKDNNAYMNIVKQVTENSFHAQKINPINDQNVNMINEIYTFLSATQLPTSKSLTTFINYALHAPTTLAPSSLSKDQLIELSKKYPNAIQKIEKAIAEIDKVMPLLSEMGKRGVTVNRDVKLHIIENRQELYRQLELIKSGKLDRETLSHVLENSEHSIRLIKDLYAIEENNHLNRKPTNVEEYIKLTVPNLLTETQEQDVQSYNKVSMFISSSVAYCVAITLANNIIKDHSLLKSKLVNERKELHTRLETDRQKKNRNARLTPDERYTIHERLKQITYELALSEYDNKNAKDCLKQINIDLKDLGENLPSDEEQKRYIKITSNSNKKRDAPSPSITNRVVSAAKAPFQSLYSGLSGIRGYFSSPPPKNNSKESFAMPPSGGQRGGQGGIVAAGTQMAQSYAASGMAALARLNNPYGDHVPVPYSKESFESLAKGNPDAIAAFKKVHNDLSRLPQIQLAFGKDVQSRPADIVSLFLLDTQKFADAYGNKIPRSRMRSLALSAYSFISSNNDIKPFIDANTATYLQNLRARVIELTTHISINDQITGQIIQDESITNILNLCEIGNVKIEEFAYGVNVSENNATIGTTPIRRREQMKFIEAISDFDDTSVVPTSVNFTIYKNKIEGEGWFGKDVPKVYSTALVVIKFKKPKDDTLYSITLNPMTFDEKLFPLMIRMIYDSSVIPSVKSFLHAIGGISKFPMTPSYGGFYSRGVNILRKTFPAKVKYAQKKAMAVLGEYAKLIVHTMERSYKQGLYDILDTYEQSDHTNPIVPRIASELKKLMQKSEESEQLLVGNFKSEVQRIGEEAISAADALRSDAEKEADKDWAARARKAFDTGMNAVMSAAEAVVNAANGAAKMGGLVGMLLNGLGLILEKNIVMYFLIFLLYMFQSNLRVFENRNQPGGWGVRDTIGRVFQAGGGPLVGGIAMIVGIGMDNMNGNIMASNLIFAYGAAKFGYNAYRGNGVVQENVNMAVAAEVIAAPQNGVLPAAALPLQQQPLALQQQPLALQQQPLALQQQPVAAAAPQQAMNAAAAARLAVPIVDAAAQEEALRSQARSGQARSGQGGSRKIRKHKSHRTARRHQKNKKRRTHKRV